MPINSNDFSVSSGSAAMEGTAAEFTYDILPYVAGRAIKDMLNLYESRFLPAAAGQLAAAQFQTAAQMDGEQIALWHIRLRSIFKTRFSRRRHPGIKIAHQQVCTEACRLQY
jgi:hypothetical protein